MLAHWSILVNMRALCSCTPNCAHTALTYFKFQVHFYIAQPLSVHSRAFRFAKHNFHSIRFTPQNRFESICPVRFAYSTTHGRNPGGWREGAAWLGAVYGVIPRKIWVPHCRVSCGNPSIGGLADTPTTSTIESDVPIFWEKESNRFA